jgi:serine/threonine protein kinase/tetratricopeptide (TPR) repeat protein
MTFREGSAVGPYEIRDRVGVGGMGEVYRAIDSRLNRTVAIKVIPAAAAGDPARRERFRREARTISSLNHPHICTIYDVGRHDGADYIVMEYLEGETLAARLGRCRDNQLPLKEALRYAIEIADALDQAHRHGVVHRDVKPANIMLTAGGAKLLDFGLATACLTGLVPTASGDPSPLTDDPASLTAEGTLVGTLAYMAPEQLEGKEADPASDLFAFGAVLFEMISGRQAFEGPNGARIVAAILEATPPAPSALRADVPPALDRVIARCLAKKPDERWQTARDLLSELKWIAEPASQPAVPAVFSRRGTRSRARLWFGVAALALLAAVPVVWIARPKPIDAIAILPLVNVSGDPQLEYLSDGIAESLISALSQVPHVKVMSSASVGRYKGRPIDARAIAKELNVKAVLVGKVGQHGDTLSISVEMIDGRDNHQIWGQQYSRPLAGIFAIQEEISKEISDKLRITLTGDAEARVAKRFTESTEAYELYLKGRYYWNKRTPQDLTRSLEYFKQAIDADPQYALAYAGLADAYNVLGSAGYDVLPPSDAIPKAKAAAVQALHLDDQLAEAHAAMGFVLRFEFDRTGAEREHQRSVALNPNYATGHQWLASHLWTQRRFEEALAQLEQAQALDPLSPLITFNMGRHFYFARDYDRAIELFQKTLQLDSRGFFAGQLLAMVYVQKGMLDAALTELRQSPAPPGPFLSIFGYVSALKGDRTSALRVIADLEALSKRRYIPPYAFATVYVGLGMKDAAFKQLQRGCLEHSAYLDYLNVEPHLDPLRADPRFADLVRCVRLSVDVSPVRVAVRGHPAS